MLRRASGVRQVLLIATFLPFCWLAMQSVHESGHVFAAWTTGGEVTRLVLHPLAISRTDVMPNPRPLVVRWAGPLAGAALPVIAYSLARLARCPGQFLFRFFAGFCLIANGVYIGIGAFDGIGDAGDLLRLGTPIWILIAFGLITAPAGLWMWHGLGKSFATADWRTASFSAALLAGIVLINGLVTTCQQWGMGESCNSFTPKAFHKIAQGRDAQRAHPGLPDHDRQTLKGFHKGDEFWVRRIVEPLRDKDIVSIRQISQKLELLSLGDNGRLNP